MRCTHEAKMWPTNCFLTLTFDDDHYPADGSINVRHLQLFMKKLRKLYVHKIRFFACGEYGGQTHRAHYHVLLFNHHFPDQKIFSQKNKLQLFTSETLSKIWTDGIHTIGPVNYQTAAYTARYALKKISGDRAADHYTRPHPLTGALVRVQPEFIVMSRRPGVGATWFDKFKSDAYPSDFLIVDGKKHPVPKFYDKLKTQEDERLIEKLKRQRVLSSHKHREDNTPERLAVREEVLTDRVQRAPRKLGD